MWCRLQCWIVHQASAFFPKVFFALMKSPGIDFEKKKNLPFFIMHISISVFYIPHWFGKKNLSRTPSAWFSWGSKPDFRSCRMTVSYPSEMFFSFREKCCYMLIFANEYAVLIESFDNRFEATPFYHILYRWSKFFCFVYMHFVRLTST